MTEPQTDQPESPEPPSSTPSPASPSKEIVEVESRHASKPLLSGADVYVVLILGVLAAAFLSGNFLKFLGFLYNPVIFLLVVTVCVTYLFFKSSDRTRAYKEELELIRGLRKRDAATRREVERRLKDFAERCRAGEESLSPAERERLARDLEQLIEELRKS